MKILVSGYFGFGNIGDEIIKVVIENYFKNYNVDTLFLTKNPKKSNEIQRDNFNLIYNTMRKVDVVLSGGGGLLQDKTSSRSLYYYLSIIQMAKTLHKKAAVFAQGIGPINKPYNRVLTRSILNKTDLITVRDNESKFLLDEIGVKREVFVTSDLAFLYEPTEVKIDPFFNFPYNILQLKGHENVNVEEVADIARFMHYKTQRETILVPFFKEIDGEICRVISEKTKFPVFVPKDIDEVFALFKGAEAVASMRYHALLFSVMLEKPVFPIVYDKKVKNLATLFGIDSLNITDMKLSHFAPEFTKFLETPFNRTELRERLKKEKENAKRNFDLFFQYLS
jgi:polysaccharide pyruvyl transferase CsaB